MFTQNANGVAMLRTDYNTDYARGLSSMKFDYNNIIRTDRKVNYRQVDWFMNNLVKRPDIDMVFACIEPDICKITGSIDRYSNHIHFAVKGKELSRGVLANSIRVNRMFLRENRSVTGMAYFTKHIGKSLSYHNIYV